MFYDELVSLKTYTQFLAYVENKFGHAESLQVSGWFYTMKVAGDPKFKFPPNEGFGINSTKNNNAPLKSAHSKVEIMVGYANTIGVLLKEAKGPLTDLKSQVKGRDFEHWDAIVKSAASKKYNIDKLWAIWHDAFSKIDDRIEHYYRSYASDTAEILSFGEDPPKVKTLAGIREHQRMKAEGKKGLFGVKKGGHTKGQFILYSAAGDNKPLLLLSSSEAKPIKKKWIDESLGVKLSGCKTFTGLYDNTNGWAFKVTDGEASGFSQMRHKLETKGGKGKNPWEELFADALKVMGINTMPKVDPIQRRDSMKAAEIIPEWE